MKFNLFLALMLMTTASHAVYEDFTTDNSTLANAQAIGDLSQYGNINIFGGRGNVPGFLGSSDDSEADFYSFEVDAGTTVSITALTPFGPEENTDPVLGLFDSSNVELAVDDDALNSGYDSFISYHFTDAGTYVIAISGYDDFDFNGTGGDTDFIYSVEISSVPVPAAVWFFGSALIGLVGLGRRKNI